MLDALLATIGILGILLTLAIKFSKAAAAAMQGAADSQDDAADAAAQTPAGRRACPHRRSRRPPIKGTGR